MKASFRPEFVNRVDEFVVFEALKLNEIRQIVRLQAKRVEQRLAEKKIKLELDESAVDYLAVRVPSLALSQLCSAWFDKILQEAVSSNPGHYTALISA